MKKVPFYTLAVVVGLFFLMRPGPADGQDLSPRFGLSLNTIVSTEDGFGPGVRFRASAPVNRELSIGVDLGLTGFVLGGRDEATYVTDPQLSAIVSIPSDSPRMTYVLGGVGAYVPFGPGLEEGRQTEPTLNIGIGQVQPLTDTSIFYEINLGLIIGEDDLGLQIPLRGGIIF